MESPAAPFCVAFTGHRSFDPARSPAAREGMQRLAAALEALYSRGARTFVCGMAAGFDLAACEAVVSLRRLHGQVRLEAAVPFPDQARRYCAADRLRYRALLEAADSVHTLHPRYEHGCYLRRDDYMVARAAVVVAWFDGSPGGTAYTVSRARRAGIEVINLWRDGQRTLW